MGRVLNLMAFVDVRDVAVHALGRSGHPADRARLERDAGDRGPAVDRLHVALCAGPAGARRARRHVQQGAADRDLHADRRRHHAGLRAGDKFRDADGSARARRDDRRRRIPDRVRARRRPRSGSAAPGRVRQAAVCGHGRQSAGRVRRRRDRRSDRLARRVLCHRRHRSDRARLRDPRLSRHERERPDASIYRRFIPNYRAVFRNPLAKYCFGAVFVEAIFLFGVFPYMAVLLQPRRRDARLHRRRGDRRLWHWRHHLHRRGIAAAQLLRRERA